ncbi:MAG TPA: pseudouridine synthase [Salinimicrobium sp.]|nr:pseudouridine synthase [Salinimicrobium sp.]
MPQHQHLKIYKPYGMLSQFVNHQKRRKNKRLLGELYDFPENTMAIGRLDEDSEGLLLLTTCGKTSAAVRSKKVEKEYYVQVDGSMTEQAIQKMKSGIEISIYGKKYLTLPCQAKLISAPHNLPERGRKIRSERHGPTSWASITLTEGKFRQVRKMTAAVGFPTLRLIRVRVGHEYLEEMQPEEVKEVKELSY